MFNWKLYDTMVEAVEGYEENITIKYERGCIYLKPSNSLYYIIFWTPMNKMPIFERAELQERLGDATFWRVELEEMRNNIDDFHIEGNGYDMEDMIQFSLVGGRMAHELHKNPTAAGWEELFNVMYKPEYIQGEYMLYKLKYGSEV